MAEATWPLERTQRMLERLIRAPEGVEKGLVAEGDPAGAALAEVLAGDARLSAVERLDVYANMYFGRLLDVLRNDYPVLARVVGETGFHNLVTDYLLAHPPSHFSLRYAGEPLAGFVATHALARRRPWLGDLARLEWSIVDAFDDVDVEPIGVEALSEVAPEDWPALRFAAVPALRILDLDWSVQPLWLVAQRQQHRDDAVESARVVEEELLPEPTRGPLAMRVWRKDYETFHREVDAAERAGLAALLAREAFGALCERVARAAPSDEDPSQAAGRAANLLATWLSDRMIAEVTLGADPGTTPA